MTHRPGVPLVSLAIVFALSGCATVPAEPEAATNPAVGSNSMLLGTQMYPVVAPEPVTTIEVYDTNLHKRVEADVLSLKSSEIRSRLTSMDTFISIEKYETSGALTYLGSSAKVERGKYKVTFDFVNYMTQEVAYPGLEGTKPIGMIAVGLRITAELDTSAKSLALGGLLPMGIAAGNNEVAGNLRFHLYGVQNDKIYTTIPTMPINLDLNGIQKAFEAAATVRALFGVDETKLEPYLIGVSRVKASDAKKVIDAATQQLTKK